MEKQSTTCEKVDAQIELSADVAHSKSVEETVNMHLEIYWTRTKGKKGLAHKWKRIGKSTLSITEMKEHPAIFIAEATELEPSANAVPSKSAEGTLCMKYHLKLDTILLDMNKGKKVFSKEWEIAKQRHT